jgi:hypothetical protein
VLSQRLPSLCTGVWAMCLLLLFPHGAGIWEIRIPRLPSPEYFVSCGVMVFPRSGIVNSRFWRGTRVPRWFSENVCEVLKHGANAVCKQNEARWMPSWYIYIITGWCSHHVEYKVHLGVDLEILCRNPYVWPSLWRVTENILNKQQRTAENVDWAGDWQLQTVK